MVLFRVRLNCIDHYQALPSRHDPQLRNDLQASLLNATKVPVIRIFGSTEFGQKVCAHVHGVFPYLYVEYDGDLNQDAVGAFIYRLHLSIDHALAISYRRDQDGDKAKFVARITLVKGIPFYGYAVGYKPFLKIYMFNPIVMTRLADLLQQGVILKRKFQPYEAHLQYLLQFMVDYNLYGCDYVESSQTYFRSPVPPRHEDNATSCQLWNEGTVPVGFVTDDLTLPRQSYCSIEVDISAQNIINRGKIKERLLHQDFSEFLNPPAEDAKLVSSMAGLWKAEARRRQRQLPPGHTPAQHLVSSFPREALVSMSADSRSSQAHAWMHEEDYRQKVEILISKEQEDFHGSQLSLGTFLEPLPHESSIKTSLQSVEDLHPSNLSAALGLSLTSARPNEDPSSNIEVDESKLQMSQIDEDAWLAAASDGSDFEQESDREHSVPSVEKIDAASPKTPMAESTEKPEAARFDVCFLGVGASGLLTGRAPRLPSPFRLVEAAQRNQLTYPHDEKAVTGPEIRTAGKRTASLSDDNTAKRLKHDVTYRGKSSPPSAAVDEARYRLQPPSDLLQPTELFKASQIDRMKAKPEAFSRFMTYAIPPPSVAEVTFQSGRSYPDVIYQDAFYSNESDVPLRRREYAGKEFELLSNTLPFLPDFDPTGKSVSAWIDRDNDTSIHRKADMWQDDQRLKERCSWRGWEIAQLPPSYDEVARWLVQNEATGPKRAKARLIRPWLSQIDGPTPRTKHNFRYSQKQPSSAVPHEAQYMSSMSLEIHVNTRGNFVPNPEEDEIQCIFWHWKDDEATSSATPGLPGSSESGILVLSVDSALGGRIRSAVPDEVAEESSELDLLNKMVEIVRFYDPDILTGYEVHGSSWGYLIERARLKYDYDICSEFSRMKTQSNGRFGKENDRWGFNTTSSIRVTGRHMINIWRAMRGEVNLLQYTMENVVWHLLHRRIPHYPWRSLTSWHRSGKPQDLVRLLRYYRTRTRLDLEILESNELISRTSEQARLLGVDFFSVFSRGSQFKVESIMFRIAKPENFMLVSPSRKQVGQQNALECLPLVMEPQSAFYSSPLVVLDFQSLYPSVMIAYNYCYSTFLGRITDWRGKSKMGFSEYRRQDGLLTLLAKHINIAPNGMMYVKPEVRKSLLAKMLTEILETRIMVKSGMKQDRDDKTLQQLLNNRQLALKLLANVTYGYTSASFSGRMPCSEIADSIVQTGRETLERATAYIHSVERWGAEVVYGDTDSLFIYLKGRSRDEAFAIGQEIAQAITERNPKPVKLKFEKVYHPCVLLAKKRYVGYKYESKDQVKPEFDAKGIETVRRDGTPAEQKIEEKALRLLFETADLSQVKDYFQEQCRKVMDGRVSIQDFCFAKEVRLGTYSEHGLPPAGAMISARKMLQDSRAEPQYGERVPYVVVTGAPGARLIDRCVSPEELLRNPHWQLDADYYITKNLIPPLERIFNLVGANVRQWYDAMPKIRRIQRTKGHGDKKRTLDAYMQSIDCMVCGRKVDSSTEMSLCGFCYASAPDSLLTLQSKLVAIERKYVEIRRICQGCEGLGPLEDVACDSHDCPVFWTRTRLRSKMHHEQVVTEPLIHELHARMEDLSLDW
ncbi:zeta catalytic subunit of dna polymerase [Trichoderma citrinoviride]|uniref:DNA polymerase n=1 Tax=Trichoderma citrinoviride TaxID=58853 RepID=A0A2T4BMF5_9HYPO|nr:zeta catalytic subunit of dna polymerase [Trichoderma citrinoviride]PTB70497.1 zeta catalytic subunit of dna polymerase [Trichoderma citrinoviride]